MNKIENKIKVSVIGTGHLGSKHCRLLKNNRLAEFVGVFDTDKERALNISTELNINAYSSMEKLMEESEAVIIASPTTTHYEISKRCLEANLHCFIEKPVTSSLVEAEKLKKIASEKPGLVIQVGHIERFNPAIKALKNYKIEPLFIEAHRMSKFNMRATDVSVVHDLMIHDIDIALWLINSPIKSIDANGVGVVTNTIDIANARINFMNGAVANLTSSRISTKPMRKVRFFQKFGYFSLDFLNSDVDVFRIDSNISASDFGLNSNSNIVLSDSNFPDLSLFETPDGRRVIFEKPEVIKTNAMEEEQTLFINSIINSEKPFIGLEAATAALEVAEEIITLL